MRARAAGKEATVLLPAAAGSIGIGVLAAEQPLAAGGVGAIVLLSLLPWLGLLTALVAFSVIQSRGLGVVSGVDIAGITIRPEQLVIVPLLLRAALLGAKEQRNRWGIPELLLVGFLAIQVASTAMNSPNMSVSVPEIGLLGFGGVAYLVIYSIVSTQRRLVLATRVVIGAVLTNAVFGLLAQAAHVVVGTHFGVGAAGTFGAGVFGLSYEHDIFASTCAAGAIVFFCLWREDNLAISTGLAGAGFLLCTTAMLFGLARGAWIGFGVALVLVLVIPARRRRRRPAAERIAVVCLLVATLSLSAASALQLARAGGTEVPGFAEKFSELLNFSSGTGRARLAELNTALADLHASPVIGLGANTYNLRHPQKEKTNYIGNIWLRALYESGLAGIILLALFLGSVLWPTRALRRSTDQAAPIARALVFGWMSLIVAYAATDDTLFMWPWILLGLARAAQAVSARNRRQMATTGVLVVSIAEAVPGASGSLRHPSSMTRYPRTTGIESRSD